MAANPILYVGHDICSRVPAMESGGIVVLRSECSVRGIRSSFLKGDLFSAVTFHNDLFAPADKVVTTARELSRAPLILFKNPAVEYNDWLFDLVIEVPPLEAGKSLREAVEEARKLQAYTRRLRQDSAAARDASRTLREIAKRNSVPPFDYDALFRVQSDDDSEG